MKKTVATKEAVSYLELPASKNLTTSDSQKKLATL